MTQFINLFNISQTHMPTVHSWLSAALQRQLTLEKLWVIFFKSVTDPAMKCIFFPLIHRCHLPPIITSTNMQGSVVCSSVSSWPEGKTTSMDCPPSGINSINPQDLKAWGLRRRVITATTRKTMWLEEFLLTVLTPDIDLAHQSLLNWRVLWVFDNNEQVFIVTLKKCIAITESHQSLTPHWSRYYQHLLSFLKPHRQSEAWMKLLIQFQPD